MELWLNYAAMYVGATFVFLLLRPNIKLKDIWFALSGMGITYVCFFNSGENLDNAAFGICIASSVAFYFILMLSRDFPGGKLTFLTIATPLITLAILKIMHINFILGYSYLTFRVGYMAYEIYIGRIRLPSITRYLGFVFFPLTFLIGPINPYRNYEESLIEHKHQSPPTRSLGRILVGILKCYIFAQLFKTLSFYSYWLPYYEHNFADFTISAISTALYIYFNFSGACDIMIGAAALLGIYVQENFNNPFFSRNLAQYWTRNHITLTQVVRDIFFTPAMLLAARVSHGRLMLLYSSILTLAAFIIIGGWHGSELGYLLFGLMHGVGVVIVNIYGAILPHLPNSYQRFSASKQGRCLSTAITFMYTCYSSVFFGNSEETLLEIWSMIKF